MADGCTVWTLCVFSLSDDRWVPIIRKDELLLVRDVATQLRFAIVEPVCLIETPDDAEYIEAFLLTVPKERRFSEVFIERWREFEKQTLLGAVPVGSA
jgi:hypothetical protein